MEFKGTKGTWISELGYEKETTIKCGEKRIAEVKHYNDGSGDWSRDDPFKEEGQANAKLIATAPEMLEQIKESLSVITWYMDNTKPEDNQHSDFFNIGMNQRQVLEDLIKKATT